MKQKNYMITGCSRGLGLGFVSLILSQGHRVWATTQNPEKAEKLKALQKKYPDMLEVLKLNLNHVEDLNQIAEKLGSNAMIDVLINNSGVYLDGQKEFEELDLDLVEESFKINTVGPMRVTKTMLPFLLRSEAPLVAHVTSLMGSIGDNSSGGSYAYRMSKAALNMFNKSFSIDYPKITSVVLHPGWVKTEMGGKQAPTEIEASISGMVRVLEKVKIRDTGKFFDFEGDELPW